MTAIVPVFFVLLLLTWLIAEVKGGRAVRVSCGILCMIVLLGGQLATSHRTALLQARHSACFRLLGEALERQEYAKAAAAVEAYNHGDASQHAAFRMLDVLTGKM